MQQPLVRTRAFLAAASALVAVVVALTILPSAGASPAGATGSVPPEPAGAAATTPTKPARVAGATAKKVSRARKPKPRVRRRKLTGKKKAGFVWPVSGPVTSTFGRRKIFGHVEPHRGMDVACSKRQAIRASKAGRVILAGRIPIYGKIVVLKHASGYSTLYAHMRKLHVRMNERVGKREVIGKCGATGRATGPHLHFEIRRNGSHRNPRPYLNR